MRLLLAILALPSLALAWEPLAIRSEPVRMGSQEVGVAKLVAGIELRSSDRRFGGISGLIRGPSGALLAVSDAGALLRFRERREGGALVGVEGGEWLALHGPDGGVHGRGRGDAEELQLLPDGRILVAYEHAHRLAVIGPESGLLTHVEAPFQSPEQLKDAPRNGGVEAMVALRGGAVFAIREKPLDAFGHHAAWLVPAMPFGAPSRPVEVVAYVTADGFQPTALAERADGSLLVLERRYRVTDGIAARLSRLARPGARPEVIGTLRPDQPCDNFEGLWLEGRRALLISDDNFNPTQRTYLLELLLPE